MNLSETELEMVTKLAGLFYTPREIALMIEADTDDFDAAVRAESGVVFNAYSKGYYEADIELRTCIRESALQGSSPAQGLLREIQKQSKVLL